MNWSNKIWQGNLVAQKLLNDTTVTKTEVVKIIASDLAVNERYLWSLLSIVEEPELEKAVEKGDYIRCPECRNWAFG